MTNQERRDAHLAYIADGPVFKELVRTRGLIQRINAHDRTDEDGIRKLVQELLGTEQVPHIVPPFYCDYGNHISVGRNVFFNYNCTLLDVGKITIGDCCVIGAGSVVTKEIPAWSLAAGNPCRVIRTITEADRKFYFKDKEFDETAWEQVRKEEIHETV